MKNCTDSRDNSEAEVGSQTGLTYSKIGQMNEGFVEDEKSESKNVGK